MKQPVTRLVKWLKAKKGKKPRAVFYKSLLLLIEVYAMALIGMSYYLAYLGQTEVLETLSQTITKVVVYPFIAFTINRTIENYSEHNTDKFRQPLVYKDDEADG